MIDQSKRYRGSAIKPTIYTNFLEANRAEHILKIMAAIAIILFPFIVYNFISKDYFVGGSALVLLSCVLGFSVYLKKKFTSLTKILFSILITICALSVPFFGYGNQYNLLFVLVYPVVVFLALGERQGLIANALIYLLFNMIMFIPGLFSGKLSFDVMFSVRLSAIYLLIIAISFFVEKIRRDMLTNFFKNAFFDELSKLPNRQYLNTYIQQAIEKKINLVLILLDLDRFQIINETLGYGAGDVVLGTMVSRVKETLRQNDLFARIGGDSFVIVIENKLTKGQLNLIVQRILTSIRDEIAINDEKLNITASLGVAFCPEHGDNTDDLIKNAEIAMYKAKSGGGNIFSIYDDEYYRQIEEKLSIQTSLKQAMDNQNLEVYYQPKISVNDGSVAGMEALLRWKREDGTYLPPDQFIPIAEECGLIYPISRWVIRESLYKLSELHHDGMTHLHMAVNISPLLFRSMTFANSLMAVVEETGLDPNMIELEITEGILMDEEDQVKRELDKIKKAGFRLAIDDFGTGYSSLSYLKQFNINALKIDRSFIMKMAKDSDYLEIVKAIVSIAKNLNLDTVAEGVEEQFEFEMLKDMDCKQIQGFYFSEAVPFDLLRKFLEK